VFKLFIMFEDVYLKPIVLSCFTILFFFSIWIALSNQTFAREIFSESEGIQEKWDATWAMTGETVKFGWLDCCAGPAERVPFTEEARKIRDAFAATSFLERESLDGNRQKCITPGMPALHLHPSLFEFAWSQNAVHIFVQDGSYRRIWTDGRIFSEDLIPAAQGTSIGYWEGDTLVVETRGISLQSEMQVLGDLKTPPGTKMIERFSVKEGEFKTGSVYAKKMLVIETTVDAPGIYKTPYTYELTFISVPLSFETGCAYANRHSGSEVDLTPPVFE
jgi:hypothetical protein